MAIRVERSVHISAPPHAVWQVMTDVERWPEWTESVKSVKRGEGGPLQLGSSATLNLRGTKPSTWTVTEFTEGASFTWETTVRGVRVRAAHVIDPEGEGSRVTLTTVSEGIIATLFFPLIIAVNRRNLKMEAEGLKERCESGPA